MRKYISLHPSLHVIDPHHQFKKTKNIIGCVRLSLTDDEVQIFLFRSKKKKEGNRDSIYNHQRP
jgi:hypothetical protein